MARFCPLCGKSDSHAPFSGELCIACARSRLPPLPTVKVSTCQKCKAIVDKGRKRKEATLCEEVVRLLKLRGKEAKFDEKSGMVEYESAAGRVSGKVEVLYTGTMCTECGRAGTQYFEAIIQLRGDSLKVERTAPKVIDAVEEKSFVPKVEEKKEGVDIYCGSRSEAISTLNAFGFGFTRTEKLAGERDGKRLYRTTLLVRL